MLISTMNDIPGYEVTEVLGEVFGLTVRSRSRRPTTPCAQGGAASGRVKADHLVNSRAARAAAHGAHNGTSTAPSRSELYWPVITASKGSQMPRSAGWARKQRHRQGLRAIAFSARSISARTSGRFATPATASRAGRIRSRASVMTSPTLRPTSARVSARTVPLPSPTPASSHQQKPMARHG